MQSYEGSLEVDYVIYIINMVFVWVIGTYNGYLNVFCIVYMSKLKYSACKQLIEPGKRLMASEAA
jgi:hypothetical protein